MPISDIFLIAYKLHGEAREFIVRAERITLRLGTGRPAKLA